MTLDAGLYGAAIAFREVSEGASFALGQGPARRRPGRPRP